MLRKIGLAGVMSMKLAGMFGKGSVKISLNHKIVI